MKFLFDLGGVFFDWDPKYFYKSIFNSNQDMNYFLDNVCNNDWNIQQDAGRSIQQAENQLISIFPEYSDKIKMYYPNHRKMIKKIFTESIRVLLDLKSKNYECFVLSNWSSETFVGMEDEYPFLKSFDGMIISGDHKLVKPNEAIYEKAILKFNLIPNETVFIDDKLENIQTAQSLKFNTIHLTNPNQIESKIKNFIKT